MSVIPDCVERVTAALRDAPAPLTLEELAAKSDLSIRMASRALDVLLYLDRVRPQQRYTKGRRGALPHVYVLRPQ